MRVAVEADGTARWFVTAATWRGSEHAHVSATWLMLLRALVCDKWGEGERVSTSMPIVLRACLKLDIVEGVGGGGEGRGARANVVADATARLFVTVEAGGDGGGAYVADGRSVVC